MMMNPQRNFLGNLTKMFGSSGNESNLISNEPPKRIAVTGAAGNIAYSILFRLASGEFLGKN